MKPSLIFQFGLKILMPFLALAALAIFWRGHQVPGGGFIGGLVAGAGIAALTFCFGPGKTRLMLRWDPLVLVFTGLFFAVASGALGLFFGKAPFEGLWVAVPLLDHLGTPQLFDLGVFLLVTGLVAVFAFRTMEVDP